MKILHQGEGHYHLGGESSCAGGHDHGDHDHDHSGHDHVHNDDHDHDHKDHDHTEHKHESNALNDSHDHKHEHNHDSDVKVKAVAKRNINVDAAFLHVLGDMIMSIGVIIAATCIYIEPTWVIADPLCTYFFSIIVCITVIPVLKSCFNVLMESSPPSIDVADMKKNILAIEGVGAMHDFHIWSISIGKYAVTAHIYSDRPQFVLKKINNMVKSKYGIDHITVQVESNDDASPDQFICHQMTHKEMK